MFTEKKALISVIIPVYNSEKYLQKCIDSLLSQNYTNFELILVNDGSTDRSGMICDEYAQKDERVKVIHQENRGVSSARNKGLVNAKGEWISFVDSDDWVSSNYLSYFLKNDIPHKSIVLQGIEYRFWNNYTKILFQYPDLLCLNNNFNKEVVQYKLYHDGCPVAKLFEKKLITENHLKFDENISINEDHIFVLQYYLYVENIILSSNIGYFYWFDYYAPSLTKRIHSFDTLNKVSKQFFKIIPRLIKEHNITDKSYIKQLYTTCGINQLFKAILNSYINGSKIPCERRFSQLKISLKYIKHFYTPVTLPYKFLKFTALHFNKPINCYAFKLVAFVNILKRKIILNMRMLCKKK